MPQVEYDTKELIRLLGRELEVEELKIHIPMMGVDLGSVDEQSINVEVFPNRPDMLSIEGFARALKGYLNIEAREVKYETISGDLKVFVEAGVKRVRPSISCAAAKNIDLTEQSLISLMQVQEKLHTTHGRNRRKVAIGVHDLDKIKPPLTYKVASPEDASFTPLEGNKPQNLKQILRSHPKGTEYSDILSGFEKYPLIVDCEENVLSFPPIINGEKSKVASETRNLFIESTGLNQKAVNQAVNIIATSLSDRGAVIEEVEIEEKI
ncbi:MAG: phenylalanine--tRNA ligase subunit beta [Candidatus Altiarchaeales archaeon]|nr:phenylalanine--tRNA ligase subunit beta [Candidatus Altiarchaeales archaeon]